MPAPRPPKNSYGSIKNVASVKVRKQPKVGKVTTVTSAVAGKNKTMTQVIRPGRTTVRFAQSKPVPLGGVKKAAAATKPKQMMVTASSTKPVRLGGVKQGSVPAKNTGGATKASWGGWSVPKKVTPLKKTAGGVARKSVQGRKVK